MKIRLGITKEKAPYPKVVRLMQYYELAVRS